MQISTPTFISNSYQYDPIINNGPERAKNRPLLYMSFPTKSHDWRQEQKHTVYKEILLSSLSAGEFKTGRILMSQNTCTCISL